MMYQVQFKDRIYFENLYSYEVLDTAIEVAKTIAKYTDFSTRVIDVRTGEVLWESSEQNKSD